jgi:basic amino acid/polyamine antiporter, APA family
MNLTEVTDLAAIGTLFAFLVVCAGVLFKDKEFGRENRFVPYVSSEWIIPALVVIGMAAFIYFADLGVFTDFFSVKSSPDESLFTALGHKIPLIGFLILLCLMIVLSVSKKLSLIPVLGVLSCAYLMTELGWTNWYRFGIWLMVGIRIYRAYGYGNSNLNSERLVAPIFLKIASVLADFVLLSLFVFPLLEWLISYPVPLWVNVIAALGISIMLEAFTSSREKIGNQE